MERKESAHGLELVKLGAIRLKGNFSNLFMGTFALVTPLILVIMVPFIMSMLLEAYWILTIGVVIFAICVGPMQIGYIKFFNDTLDGKQPKTSLIYSQFRFNIFTLRTIYITTLLIFMYLLGGILWLVPAGFAISFFSMILFFLEKYNYPRLSLAFKDCATQMVGNRLALFAYKLIFYLVYFMLFMVAGLCMALVYTLAMDSLIISWIIAVCSMIVFIFLYTMVTVYYHSCNQIFFEDALMHNEKKRERARKEKEAKAFKNQATPTQTESVDSKVVASNDNSKQEKKEVVAENKVESKIEDKVEDKKESKPVKTTKVANKSTKTTANKSTKSVSKTTTKKTTKKS